MNYLKNPYLMILLRLHRNRLRLDYKKTWEHYYQNKLFSVFPTYPNNDAFVPVYPCRPNYSQILF